MLDVLSFLAAPFAACLVLVGILGYFGIHVLRREVRALGPGRVGGHE